MNCLTMKKYKYFHIKAVAEGIVFRILGTNNTYQLEYILNEEIHFSRPDLQDKSSHEKYVIPDTWIYFRNYENLASSIMNSFLL